MKAASLGAGLNAAAVQQITKGKDPQASTLIKLATAHTLSLDEILLGDRPANGNSSRGSAVKLAPVVGFVQAGLWFDESNPPQIDFEPIPYVSTRYGNLEQRAYRVVGPSMNKRRIEDGDFVITVPYWQARNAPQDNDIVVVEQRRASEIQRTVKELVVRPDRIELMPRSTDPAFQVAIVIPRNASPDDTAEVEIVGLVIGRFSPM